MAGLRRAGDLYRRHYEGLYCVGCEQFYDAGRADATGAAPSTAPRRSWSPRRTGSSGCPATPTQLREADHQRPAADRARRRAATRCSRSSTAGCATSACRGPPSRAGGWGIPVPGDPGQVIYVWWDALGNYVTALGYGDGRRPDLPALVGRSRRARVHVVGKGVLRFHAVYWPAMLLSAGLPLPTDIFVHDYLTVDGRKISKSGAAPAGRPGRRAGRRYGADAVRWWLLREVPRVGDADFTVERLVARGRRGPGQRPGQPGQPGGRHGRTGTAMAGRRRARPSGAPGADEAGRGRAGGRRRGRRRAGGVRLPRGHGGRLEHRGGGEPLRRPGPAVGPGQERTGRGRGARRRAVCWCGACRCSAGSWRRSCPTRRPASPPSARRR